MSLFYSVLFLILILILGILLAPFLGGNKEGLENPSPTNAGQDGLASTQDDNLPSSSNVNSSYDHYNHYTGTSSPMMRQSTYYGPNGEILTINMNGTNTLSTVDKNGGSTLYAGVPNLDGTVNTFTGPNGSKATVVTLSDNSTGISITESTGKETLYTSTAPTSSTNNYQPNVTPSSTPSSLLPPSSQTSSYDYSSSLPPGIPASQIPAGQEDLYILKSEIVPPVCPVCPVQTKEKKCPPCPACARCPEPAYNCKLVPNYSSMNANAPIPILNDFSSFGM